MSKKTTQITIYMLYSILSSVIYGAAMYFLIYQGLAGEAVLAAYLWNILFIIIFLILDKVINEFLLSKELVINKDTYLAARIMHGLSFVSFKTTLYLFYTFILIISRVSILEPDLINDNFRYFVLSIEYCLILVVTFDKYSEYLLKDEQRIKRISAKFHRFEKLATFVAKKRMKEKKKKR